MENVMSELRQNGAEKLADEFGAYIVELPPDDHDREINNIGHCIYLILKHNAPDLPEATQYALPFAFSELLRERVARLKPPTAPTVDHRDEREDDDGEHGR
jgi:hypothetical protein